MGLHGEIHNAKNCTLDKEDYWIANVMNGDGVLLSQRATESLIDAFNWCAYALAAAGMTDINIDIEDVEESEDAED